MDKLDKFNNTVMELFTNWKYIFYFVAGIYFLSTIWYLFEFEGDPKIGLTILSWIILVLIAIIMRIVIKDNKEPY